ncbi:Non-specific serine/threonine protein kinase [Mycena indigotica]|uniref:non-specific serine/threonine protein kinase n=1 Tax=Mycena indigotica TaxID=2126181 RepID=A0A8H6VVK8_9AGAR|nr:Non-specific serine/threonine protein kinase [Mycena indigotica]KAF7289884.1 Non-specific serine/threonine protein kinase [Mycena indigotica]
MAHEELPASAAMASGSSRAMSAAVLSSHQQRPPRQTESHEAKQRSAPPRPDVFSHPAVTAYVANHPNRPIPKFGAYYMLQTLGEGEFGKVKLGIHVKYGEEVAVKLLRREAVEKESRMAKIGREIEILDLLKHPNIVRLYDVCETDKFFGIILEFASGGELFDHILAHRYLRERDAAKLFAQLISGVWYMHQKNIVHRDLKLENLLLDRNRNLIITDFGFANHFNRDKNEFMETMCGSPCYAAPELVNAEGNYVGTMADVWSCGVILYAMLSGYLPFDDDPTNPEGEDINKLYKYIATTPLTYPEHISDDACSLLSIMLVPNPSGRADLATIMRHRWFASNLREATTFGLTVKELEKLADEGSSLGGRAYRKRKDKPEEKKDKDDERRSRSKRNDAREGVAASPSRSRTGETNTSGRSATASPLREVVGSPRRRREPTDNGDARERTRHTIEVGYRQGREQNSSSRGNTQTGRSTPTSGASLPAVPDDAEPVGSMSNPGSPSKDRHKRGTRASGHTAAPNVRTVFLSPVVPSSSLESTSETMESLGSVYVPHNRATTELPNGAAVDLSASIRSRPLRTQSDAARDSVSKAQARAGLPPLIIDSSSSSGLESKPPSTPLNNSVTGLPIPISASPSKPNKVMQWFRRGRRTTVSAGLSPATRDSAAASSVEVASVPHAHKSPPLPPTPTHTNAQASPFLVMPGTGEHRQRTSSAVSITSLFRRSAGVAGSSKTSMRVHHGAVDHEMITAGRPAEVMKHLWEVLAGMGVEIYVEGDFKYRCTRPAKRTGRERDRREASGGDTSGVFKGLLSRRQPSPARSIAEQQSIVARSTTPQPPRPDAVYGYHYEDSGDEVRFSVELTKLDRLKDMYSVDIRRMKGNLKSYKFLYDTLRGRVDLQT